MFGSGVGCADGRAAQARSLETFTLDTWSQRASSISADGRKPSMMPAMLASASTRPPAASTNGAMVFCASGGVDDIGGV
ncbi:hypothetical protein ATY41_05315 [Leifsonia xyli subsp. xyli]|uniref:Uncharacterized protein n=1 Tax=Leifsonia xyli subsp. xyli TaxID=59736 RepID=A0A1E2SID2_LEIXY|nr:hypothetical protein ATY41_05315 [Leifsonia xyli subsp. xyli]